MKSVNLVKYECHCPKCSWRGFWDDADREVTWSPSNAFGSPAYQDEHVYFCPLCGEELEEA
jgi:hypothetical protein